MTRLTLLFLIFLNTLSAQQPIYVGKSRYSDKSPAYFVNNKILYFDDFSQLNVSTGEANSGTRTVMSGTDIATIFNNKLYFAGGSSDTELWATDGVMTTRIKDIFPGRGSGFTTSYPTTIVVFKNKLYFAADDGLNGIELWQSDGTEAGTKLLKDLNIGAESSIPRDFIVLNDKLFFMAGLNDDKLWRTDGTEQGTKIFSDSIVGMPDFRYHTASTVFKNKLFFTAYTPQTGVELWVTDGTIVGSKLFKDIKEGQDNTFSDLKAVVLNDSLYLSNGYELYSTDGTPEKTKLLFENSIDNLTVVENKLFFVDRSGPFDRDNNQVWVYNPATGTTSIPRNIGDVSDAGSDAHFLVEYRKKVFFVADDAPNGDYQMWQSDGTTAGTQLAFRIRPDRYSELVTNSFVAKDRLYFFAADISAPAGSSVSADYGLWYVKIDSFLKITQNFTTRSCERNGNLSIQASGGVPPYKFKLDSLPIQLDNIFTNVSPTEHQLRVTDAIGTTWQNIIKLTHPNLPPFLALSAQYDMPHSLIKASVEGGKPPFLFRMDNNTPTRDSLWRFLTEGVHQVTVTDANNCTSTQSINIKTFKYAVKDVATQGINSNDKTQCLGNYNTFTFNNRLFYNAKQGLSDINYLWVYDDNCDAPRIFKFHNNFTTLSPLNTLVYQGKLYILTIDAVYESDGTEQGTTKIASIDGTSNTTQSDLVSMNDKLLFYLHASNFKDKLWSLNLTTRRLELLCTFGAPAANRTAFSNFVDYKNKTYFHVETDNSALPNQIWVTDGTALGTNAFKITDPTFTQRYAADARPLIVFNNKLILDMGRELYETDATNESVNKCPWATYINLRSATNLKIVGDKLYHIDHEGDLAVTDGTIAGTKKLKKRIIGDYKIANNKVYFRGPTIINDPYIYPDELWVTEGTEQMTRQVTRISKNNERNNVKNTVNSFLILDANTIFYSITNDTRKTALCLLDTTSDEIKPLQWLNDTRFEITKWGNKIALSAEIDTTCRQLKILRPIPVATLCANYTFDPDPCSDSTGRVTIPFVTGGVKPYTYQIDNTPPQYNTNFEHISIGTHQIKVKDALGTGYEQTITLSIVPLKVSAYVKQNADCGGNIPELVVKGEGGKAPFVYSVNFGYFQSDTLFERVQTNGGDLTVTVKDANGCTRNRLIKLVAGTPFQIVARDTCGQNAQLSIELRGGQPPYKIAWGTGNAADTTPILRNLRVNQTYLVFARDANNCAVYREFPIRSCVWPGDADNNKIVNHLDLFPIAYNLNESGFSRLTTHQNNQWYGHVSAAWSKADTNQVNLKMSDTNGDGIVTADDTTGIRLNWSKTHQIRPNSVETREVVRPLYVKTDGIIDQNGITSLPIFLGDGISPIDSVFALAFSIQYDKNLIDPQSVYLSFNTSWMDRNPLHVYNNDANLGQVDVATARSMSKSNAQGSGEIARLNFKSLRSSNNKTAKFTIGNVLLQDVSKIVIPVMAKTTQMTILTNDNTINDSDSDIQLYPNPVANTLFIENQKTPLNTVSLFDMTGKLISHWIVNDYKSALSLTILPSGSYFLRITTTNNVFMRKIVKL